MIFVQFVMNIMVDLQKNQRKNHKMIQNDNINETDNFKYDSSIFETLVKRHKEYIPEDLKPQDITESIHLEITDDFIENSNCRLIAYNIHVNEKDDSEAYNPKKNPDKAIDIEMAVPKKNLNIEIFLDTPSLEWNSVINGSKQLSPEQMEQFFNTKFYHKIYNKLTNIWPSSDKLFGNLLNAIKNKKYSIDGASKDIEKIDEDGEFRKANIDPEKSRQKNAAGKQEYTRSGRKIITFSDFGVKHTDDEAYFSWPEKNKEFKWSQWADWKKIHPLLRMRFKHNDYVYGISLSPFTDTSDNRGWRAYNLDLQPALQYLTPEETQQMLDLSIVQKFLKHSVKRLLRYLSIPDEEIYKKINRPDKCTIDDIRKTKHVIKNTMSAVRDGRADTYIYT